MVFAKAGFQLAIRKSQVSLQLSQIIFPCFFYKITNSKFFFFLHKNMFVHFILYFAHEFIQEMFLNNFY